VGNVIAQVVYAVSRPDLQLIAAARKLTKPVDISTLERALNGANGDDGDPS
jgi:hypothetical protein